MKITMYELLGLVKDGKAPKKIKYHNYICYYDDGDYKLENGSEWLFANEYIDLKYLNETVEILEEEKKIPEKLKLQIHHSNLSNLTLHEEQLEKNDNTLVDCFEEVEKKFNEIIDYLKSKGDE